MKNLKLIHYVIAIFIAAIACLTFTQIVTGMVEKGGSNYFVSQEGIESVTGTLGVDDDGRGVDNEYGRDEDVINDCVKIGATEWDCTDNETLLKLKNYVGWKEQPKTFRAIITWYNRASSCHNPRITNGKVECLTAIGRDTQEGRTIACPRNIKLGTRLKVNGKEYVCEDRYARYLDTARELPTVDIFYEANPGWGKMVVDVEYL